jgi:5'-nucleotidase (lipoprotein e(P4) family)
MSVAIERKNFMNRNFIKRIFAVVLLLLLTSVSSVFSGTVVKPEDLSKLSDGVRWVYVSDEYKLCCRQAYDYASCRLPALVKGKDQGLWCVVVDMDETLASNVECLKLRDLAGGKYSDDSWHKWCLEGKCTPLPGALEFNRLVKKLGGRFIVITNRSADEGDATIKNLKEIGFRCDAVIFKAGPYATDDTKQWRRDDLTAGKIKTLPKGVILPPLDIVMLGGDQISDFYDPICYNVDDIKDAFSSSMILLPNPQYGFWEENYKAYYNRTIKVGQEICFWLKSNPTTGYKWSLASPEDGAIIKKVGSE